MPAEGTSPRRPLTLQGTLPRTPSPRVTVRLLIGSTVVQDRAVPATLTSALLGLSGFISPGQARWPGIVGSPSPPCIHTNTRLPPSPCTPRHSPTHHSRKVHLRMRVRRGSAVTSTPSGAIHSVSCSHHSPVRLGSRPASSPGANCPPLRTTHGSGATRQGPNFPPSFLGAMIVLHPTRPTQAKP